MKWSQYSENIFDTFTDDSRNIIVQAVPGSGKTTNISHIWTMDDKSTLYIVFNKHIQVEAQSKLPLKSQSSILTLNSLGHRAVTNNIGNVVLDSNKVMKLVRDDIQYDRTIPFTDRREMQYAVKKCVDLAKGCITGYKLTKDEYTQLLSTYDLDSYEGMLDHVNYILALSDKAVNVIDYNDQLRFPVIYNLPMPEYHTVLGDEVQDFNSIQVALLQRLQAKRYVLVGDRKQSIYSFRGAMNNSMDYLKDQFNCVELPLSITYRCATDIVKVAQGIYPEIEPWDESPVGLVRQGSVDEMYTSNHLIVCRNNRPLVSMAYELLKRNIPCHMLGRDIASGLIALIKRQECTDVRSLIDNLQEEYSTETYKATIAEDEGKVQRIADKYESALLFCGQYSLTDTPDEVMQGIQELFENGQGVTLSTVHKAKGLEATSVHLLEPQLYGISKNRAKNTWQQVQETNIHYVAVTRAKEELVYL